MGRVLRWGIISREGAARRALATPEVSDQSPLCAGGDRDMDRFREKSGIYGLGFRKESVVGLIFPFIIVGIALVVALLVFRIR